MELSVESGMQFNLQQGNNPNACFTNLQGCLSRSKYL